MKKVRCKMKVTNVSKLYENGEQTSEAITFSAKYSDNKDDNSFSKYTPSANSDMVITNKDVFGFFEQGEAYYFDITKSEEPVKAQYFDE